MQNYYLLTDDFHDHDILPELCKKYLKEGSVVLDIGGNMGNHTVFFNKYCRLKQTWTFEPVKETFSILKKNIYLNNLTDKVILLNVGLGAKEGVADVDCVDKKNSGANRLVEKDNGNCKVVTLDSLNIGKVDFVKIDVEGFEYNVIRGGCLTLQQSDATIFIEIFPENFKRVNDVLKSLGYELVKDPMVVRRHDFIYQKKH